MNEKKITIKGIIEKNIYRPVKKINNLTIKTKEATYSVIITDKKYGMIQIGELVKITGTLDQQTNEIKNSTIEWM